MRLFITNFVLAGLVLFGATSASALALSLSTADNTIDLNPGDQITIQVRLDTQGETQVTSVFSSLSNSNPGALAFVSGTSPGQILFNTSTFEGVARVSQPVDGVTGDPPGQVRAANFATATETGSGVASANQLLATLIFEAVGAGAGDLMNLLNVGDDEVTVTQISVTGSVALGGPISFSVVPEPGTALLMGLGLAGLAAAGRRTA